MNAIIWTGFGPPDVLAPGKVEKPAPKDKQVLIKIFAATVNTGDCEMRSMSFGPWLRLPMKLYVGFSKPTRITILGQELAGEIEAVGKEVKLFRPGDQIFAASGLKAGAYAEYTCLPEDAFIAIKPGNMTFDEAATLPVGGMEAAHFLKQADIRRGQKVLINGAGGGIGTIAVQLAKYYGASVTAVDRGEKLEMLRALGADRVLDYTQQDFTANGERYDVIFDIVGKGSILRSQRVLSENGIYLSANPNPLQVFQGQWSKLTSRKRAIVGASNHDRQDLNFIRELAEAGKIKAVIDRRYALAQTAEAHRYVEQGLKKGSVVITVRDTC